MTSATPLVPIAVACVAGVSWYVAVPPLVRVRHPRYERNADHFAKIVRFHRVWGISAILIGVALAWAL